MITCLVDNFLKKEDCEKLISFYEENIDYTYSYGQTKILSLFGESTTVEADKSKFNHIFNALSNTAKILNNSKIDWMHLVKWPTHSFQGPHLDDASDKSTLTSITYLNDNYKGGQTFYKDDIIFKPKQCRSIFFDGKYYRHGVKKITKGTRYTIATWYKKI